MIVLILLYATWLVQGLYKEWYGTRVLVGCKQNSNCRTQQVCLLASEATTVVFCLQSVANYSIIKFYNTEYDKYAIT